MSKQRKSKLDALTSTNPFPTFKLTLTVGCSTPGVTPGILSESFMAALEHAGMDVRKLNCKLVKGKADA